VAGSADVLPQPAAAARGARTGGEGGCSLCEGGEGGCSLCVKEERVAALCVKEERVTALCAHMQVRERDGGREGGREAEGRT